jgi:hypothetical protein
MVRNRVLNLGVLIAATGGFNHLATAQQPAPAAHVAFRLAETKTSHFDDPQKAEQHREVLEKLGCEVSQGSHAGHIDLTYRCPKWRALPVASEDLAHQWEKWLKDAGFETLHGHAAEHRHDHGHDHAHTHTHDHAHGDGAHEVVSYRQLSSVKVHPQRPDDAEELVAIVKGLGCDVRESQHADHRDISISCPDWKHAAFASHEAAEAWQQWLAGNGFEVQHTH